MEIGKIFYATGRERWRSWLKKNHAGKKEIWLLYYKVNSGKARIPYNDAVEEALCYGWIDSTVKSIDEDRFAQRFSPRRKGSMLSDMNKERIRMMIMQKKMTQAGLDAVKHAFDVNTDHFKFKKPIAADIMKALKKDKIAWENFNKFPESYKRIRIGWIEGARSRPEVFKQRLQYFLKMTVKNKKFGMVQ